MEGKREQKGERGGGRGKGERERREKKRKERDANMYFYKILFCKVQNKK
jgi:hypothetical protein